MPHVSAQVLLVLTLGLWTQTLDLGLDLDCDNISKHCIVSGLSTRRSVS